MFYNVPAEVKLRLCKNLRSLTRDGSFAARVACFESRNHQKTKNEIRIFYIS